VAYPEFSNGGLTGGGLWGVDIPLRTRGGVLVGTVPLPREFFVQTGIF
jgi:hypothetical protein